MKEWMYDEFSHVGVDYSTEDVATIYDDEMEKYRDYDEEVKVLIEKLSLDKTEEMSVIDLGCGTGAFAIHAAKYFNKIIAVDVSDEMLRIAERKAELKQIENVDFINSGFLRFSPIERVDLVNTKWAMHHLPDFWKQAALLNINSMLKPGGMFYLTDVVFKFDPEYKGNLEHLLEDMGQHFSKDFVEETKLHFKEEFSTFDWVLQGMIERAGFVIEWTDTNDILESEYICRKIIEL